MAARVGHVVVAGTSFGDGPRRIAFIGAGAADEWDAEGVRRFAGRAVRAAEARELATVTIVVPEGPLDPALAAQSAAEGALLAAWMLTDEGQRLLEDGWTSTSLYKPGTPAAEIAAGKRLALATFDWQVANTMRLQKLYEDIIVKK